MHKKEAGIKEKGDQKEKWEKKGLKYRRKLKKKGNLTKQSLPLKFDLVQRSRIQRRGKNWLNDKNCFIDYCSMK